MVVAEVEQATDVLGRLEMKNASSDTVRRMEKERRRARLLARLPPEERARREARAKERDEAATSKSAVTRTTSYGRLVRSASAATTNFKSQLAAVRFHDKRRAASSALLPGIGRSASAGGVSALGGLAGANKQPFSSDPVLSMWASAPYMTKERELV